MSVGRRIHIERFQPPTAARDLLRLSLAVVAADRGIQRKHAQDGWTRQIDLELPIEDVATWKTLQPDVEAMLQFLTGDIWSLKFKRANHILTSDKETRYLEGDAVSLLSGGADSLVGAIDLAATDTVFNAVSQTSSDSSVQRRFAEAVSAKRHLRWTHGVHIEGTSEGSQRARSIGFFGFALIAATATEAHRDGGSVDLHASENGLISLNPALTPARVGSASTRTTHPTFIRRLQNLIDRLELRVSLRNNYQQATKGEMYLRCAERELFRSLCFASMSCGKGGRINMHCGRCVPCIIRRAAFRRANIDDQTRYKHGPGADMRGFEMSDDVRCAYLGSSNYADRPWIERTILPSLFACHIEDRRSLVDVASRGLKEVHDFLSETLA